MSNNIFYDPYNEIRCDRFALEKLVKESEAKDQRIAELEQDLEFTTKTANELIEIKHKLEQQLAETEQKFLEFQEDSIRNEQIYVRELAEKDKEIAHLKEKDNYHLRYELAGADETITNLKQQLVEKDKEIERLKVFEKAYYFNLSPVSKEYIKLMLQNAYQTPNQTQLAIQELEKVKDFALNNTMLGVETVAVLNYIYEQIKLLKGEKDEN